MTKILLVAGSNSGHQLGVGHDRDVRTLQEALCRVDSDSQQVTSLPPAGYTVVDLSSGANHTLALLERIQDGHGASSGSATKEVWIAGTGAQGQLGPAHASSGSKPLTIFTRLDLEALLDNCADLPRSDWSGALLQPKRIVAGWNCSYIVLALGRAGPSESSEQDVLLSLGLLRDNTFGELGCAVRDASNVCVHKVSFSSALIEAGLDTNVGFQVVDVAAGLRHAVAALSVKADAQGQRGTIVVGWGSARQGQVGRIPEPAPKRPGSSNRPGPAAAIVWEPQVIFDWKTSDSSSIRCRLRAGRDHTVVLVQGEGSQEGKELHCIGSNKQGQLLDASLLQERGAALDQIVDVTCNWNSTHLLVEQSNGERAILSCGSNSRGQLGNSTTVSTTVAHPLASADLSMILQQPPSTPENRPTTLRRLVSGSEHSLLLVKTGDAHQVWGWGWNEHGNLAQGVHDEADRQRATLLLDGTRSGTDAHYDPLDVWAGLGTSFILAERLGRAHAA